MSADTKLCRAMEKYGDMIYRICVITLKNTADAEDAVQETFLIYYRKSPDFSSSEHEKAWLITVASNKCRDILRTRKRRSTDSEELLANVAAEPEDNRILDALLELPEKFRTVLTLYYVEGFKVDEIAKMIGKTPSAVKMRLSKGRKLLDEQYRKEIM